MKKKMKNTPKDVIVKSLETVQPIEMLGDRTIVALGSAVTVDRMNETIPIEAWDIKKYTENNPIILLHHDHKKPVGKAQWVKKDPRGLIFKIKFANTKDGNEYYQLYQEGVMNSFSVGFINKAKMTRLSDGVYRYNNVELTELSCVTVPANADAIVLEKSLVDKYNKDEIQSEELRKVIKKYLGEIMKSTEETKDVLVEEKAVEEVIEEKAEVTEETVEEVIEEKAVETDATTPDELVDEAIKQNPVTAVSGGYSVWNIIRLIDEKLYNEGFWFDDAFIIDVNSGSCVGSELETGKCYEFNYTIKDGVVNLENKREVQAVYIKKDIGKIMKNSDVKNELHSDLKKSNENSLKVLAELKSLADDLKKVSNTNIIKNEIEKLSADTVEVEEKAIKVEKVEEIVEEPDTTVEDVTDFIKSWAQDIKSELSKDLTKNSLKDIVKGVLDKELGKI